MLTLLAGSLILFSAGPVTPPQAEAFPKVPLPAQASEFGRGVARTMKLLTYSTAKHRNTVRILFYGQSITEQKWCAEVGDWLRKTYPNANLVIENRAIGGHSSQLLWRTAESDLYPFQPDLLIFYVYGSHIDYERIIANTRKLTTADVMIQTNHITKDSELAGDQENAPPDGAHWEAFFNRVFLPDLAKRYRCELVDQRSVWRDYLNQNHLRPSQFLIDGVHLNDAGCHLMAEIVKTHFRVQKPSERLPVTDAVVGKDVKWTGNRLRFEFEGNRIDAISPFGAKPGTATFTIDGKPAAQFEGAFATTRPTTAPGTNWPILLRPTLRGLPRKETWTASLRNVSADGKKFDFDLAGSIAGADGSGVSDQTFVSPSGRIAIEPEDWNLSFITAVFHPTWQLPIKVSWEVVPRFVSTYSVPIGSDLTVDGEVSLVQGLPSGKHVLEITSPLGKALPIKSLRVYRPAF